MKSTHSTFFLAVLMFLMLTGVAAMPTTLAADDGCVIPESGPWPPCATGGNGDTSNDGCMIPESGPWPPCATGGDVVAPSAGNVNSTSVTTWVIHQGRGAKQTPIVVQGLQASSQITRVEVEIDFTYSAAACSASPQAVEKDVLGYALVSPSGTQIDLFAVGDLTGMQNGARAKMRFADNGNQLNHIASGRYQPADSLAQFAGENPLGEWQVVMTKQSFKYAVCQHSATLHITTTDQLTAANQ